jgi:adenine-specific DNA-methyltransferase
VSRWDLSKRDKRKETGLVGEVIDFSQLGGGDNIVTDGSRIGSIVSVLKNFKNPYVGNKRKLIPFIIEVIDKHDIEYNSVLDLFSGSAFCSMAFKMLGKKVISNDLLSCSYLNAVAFVQNKDIVLSEEEQGYLFAGEDPVEWIIDDKFLNRLDEGEIEIISSYYKRAMERWGSPIGRKILDKSTEDNIKSALAIAYMQNYIIENCFVGGGLNSGQILAEYDHRIDHPRNKGYNMFFNGRDFSYSNMRWQSPIYPTDTNQHECYNLDAIEMLCIVRPEVDLVYIDPPYGGGQSDYSSMYELFEGMLHGKLHHTSGEFRHGADRFINKDNYKENFSTLMADCKDIPNMIISYNDTSWGTIDEICEVVREHRNNVVVEEFDYSYKYRDKKNNNKGTKEYIIIAKE